MKETSPRSSIESATRTLFGTLKENFQWVLLFLGVILLVVGYILPHVFVLSEPWTVVVSILRGLGELVIVGVLLGFLSTHDSIINNYRRSVEDVFYGEDHLKNRTDISEIWGRVTDALVKNKYPGNIRDVVLDKIKSFYLPDKNYCYENYQDNITIQWADSDKTKVKVVSTTNFNIISMKREPITLFGSVSSSDVNNYRADIKLFLDGTLLQATETEESDQERGNISKKVEYILPGDRDKYKLKRIITKSYDIKRDGSYIAVYVYTITHNMQATLNHPEDMDVQFLKLGTSEEFDLISKQSTSCAYKLEGIVMPEQGFCFIIERKES